MKKLQNLKGAKALNKKEQLNIKGGAGGLSCVDSDNGFCLTCSQLEECVEVIEGVLGEWCVVGYACIPIIGNQ